MDNKIGPCKGFFGTLNILLDIGSFICICILVSISSKNPFQSHIIGDIDKYYNSYPVNTTFDLDKRRCEDNSTFNHNNTKENVKKLNLRKLESDSFCEDIQESFVRNKMKRLSYIFNLKYEKIRGISIALLVLFLCMIVFTNLTLFVSVVFSFICLLIWIAKFVLFILLFHFFEKGDIGKYEDFLDCTNVKKSFFTDNFSDINKLRKTFIAFTVFNLLSEIFGRAESLFEPCDEKIK